jgi:hypothetical protein
VKNLVKRVVQAEEYVKKDNAYVLRDGLVTFARYKPVRIIVTVMEVV